MPDSTPSPTSLRNQRDRPLRPRPPEETLSRLATYLQSMGNLSAYVDSLEEPDGIALKTFSANPACSTLPVPTLRNVAVAQDRLERARRTIEILNETTARGDKVAWALVSAECLDAQGRPDARLTRAVASAPPMRHEPAAAGATTLPRLTPAQIKAGIASRLREGADLAAYFVVDPQGSLRVRTFPPSGSLPPACRTGRPVDKNRIGLLGQVLQQLNEALKTGSTPAFALQ